MSAPATNDLSPAPVTITTRTPASCLTSRSARLSSSKAAYRQAAIRQAGRYITDQSYQFSADIAAVAGNGRGYCREKFVFDLSTGKPRIVYRQDLSAYGWALVNPIRKLWYNLTITAASVAVAIFIGGIEALGLLSDKLSLTGGVWDVIGDLNDNLTNFGFAVVGVFLVSWLISTLVYRANRYDDLARP